MQLTFQAQCKYLYKFFNKIRFASQTEKLYQLLKKGNKDTVIFHCMYSQQRGPKCGYIFNRFLRENYPESDINV